MSPHSAGWRRTWATHVAIVKIRVPVRSIQHDFRKSRKYDECVRRSNLKVKSCRWKIVAGAPEMRENLDANKAIPIGAGIDMTATHDAMIQAAASSAPRYGH